MNKNEQIALEILKLTTDKSETIEQIVKRYFEILDELNKQENQISENQTPIKPTPDIPIPNGAWN